MDTEKIGHAIRRIRRRAEERKGKRFRQQVTNSEHRRLFSALAKANRFTGETERFARDWARYWLHAARTVRQYGEVSTIGDLDLPDSDAFVVARELFEEALSESHPDRLGDHLAKYIELLHPVDENGAPAEDSEWALRAFFASLARCMCGRLGLNADGVLQAYGFSDLGIPPAAVDNNCDKTQHPSTAPDGETIQEILDHLITRQNFGNFLGQSNIWHDSEIKPLMPNPVWCAKRCHPWFRVGDLVAAVEHRHAGIRRRRVSPYLRKRLKLPGARPDWYEKATTRPS